MGSCVLFAIYRLSSYESYPRTLPMNWLSQHLCVFNRPVFSNFEKIKDANTAHKQHRSTSQEALNIQYSRMNAKAVPNIWPQSKNKEETQITLTKSTFNECNNYNYSVKQPKQSIQLLNSHWKCICSCFIRFGRCTLRFFIPICKLLLNRLNVYFVIKVSYEKCPTTMQKNAEK